jgi:predicted dehydrogenase
MSFKKLTIGVVGLGYWGPNWIRNIRNNSKFDLSWVIDTDLHKLNKFASIYNIPSSDLFTDGVMAIKFKKPDLVIIATPPSTHLKLAKFFCDCKVNLIIEKPIGVNKNETMELINYAKQSNIKVFIDNTYIFTPAAIKIKEILTSSLIGDLQFLFSSRLNLGLIQKDVNVIRDLAIHDIALLDYFIEKNPNSLSASAVVHKPSDLFSTASLSLKYDEEFFSQISVSWNSPIKVRSMIISGSQKSIVWDDVSINEKVKLIDVSANALSKDNALHVSYTLGNTTVFHLDSTEAITNELNHIYDVLSNNVDAINGIEHIERVAKVLDDCENLLDHV